MALIASFAASAQNFPKVQDEYSKALTARSDVTRLDPDQMFGDSIGLYTGSLEFLQTDAILPGNNGLEVAIRRKLKMGERPLADNFYRGWQLAIPSIHGVFSEAHGWSTSKGSDPSKRCSNFWWPAAEVVKANSGVASTKVFLPEEFWFGTFLYLPSSGDQPIFNSYNYDGTDFGWPRPTDGASYPLRTKDGYVISCIPSEDGTSEGFEVHTTDGVVYRINHMAIRPMVPLLKSEYWVSQGSQQLVQWVMKRQEYVLLVTSARDRFGNTVTYDWDPSNPWQLKSIRASDGRRLDLTWSGGQVAEVRSGDKVWSYSENRIIYPDKSYWDFTSMDLSAASYDEGSVPGNHSHCYYPGDPTTKKMHAVMRHPSGAIATFDAAPTLHGRSQTPDSCGTKYDPNTNFWDNSSEAYPATYYLWSVTSKSISGPGLSAPLTWTYSYSPANGCYKSPNQMGTNTCTSSSPSTKWVDVTDPSGIVARYTFGNQYSVSEGFLLSTVQPGREVTQEYSHANEEGFLGWAGILAMPPRSNPGGLMGLISPIKKKVIIQDGERFEWTVTAYDKMARPLSITKSSAPQQ
ncbi:wall associated protein [Xanthomonas sacchari]|uniref:wall associated protein n=1 Tax=Xanthomonas sacchari TaxID=56458 RepID=UPI00225BEC4F|nr:wall associated protein [Xanthomonas sacchari]UYK66528.1 wall associated protein [Xanthomonas sacchari]